MLTVYGLAPSKRISTGIAEVEFPAFHGRPVGGAICVDCNVSVVKLGEQALGATQHWAWQPVQQGYVVALVNKPFGALKNHLRSLRFLQDESVQNRLWPWFDPRYMKLALSSLEGDDLIHFFGPVHSFAFACEAGIELFQQQEGRLQVKRISPC